VEDSAKPVVETTGAAAAAEADTPPRRTAASEGATRGKKSAKRKDSRQSARLADTNADDAPASEQTARHGDRKGGRPVKRWRELVYDYPDGTRRRVIIDGARATARPAADTGEDTDAEEDD
jgi:hypothetical protein